MESEDISKPYGRANRAMLMSTHAIPKNVADNLCKYNCNINGRYFDTAKLPQNDLMTEMRAYAKGDAIEQDITTLLNNVESPDVQVEVTIHDGTEDRQLNIAYASNHKSLCDIFNVLHGRNSNFVYDIKVNGEYTLSRDQKLSHLIAHEKQIISTEKSVKLEFLPPAPTTMTAIFVKLALNPDPDEEELISVSRAELFEFQTSVPKADMVAKFKEVMKPNIEDVMMFQRGDVLHEIDDVKNVDVQRVVYMVGIPFVTVEQLPTETNAAASVERPRQPDMLEQGVVPRESRGYDAKKVPRRRIVQSRTDDTTTAKNKPLTDAEKRQILHMLDLAEAEKHNKSDGEQKMTMQHISKLTNRHLNTIAKIKRERDRQQCLRIHDEKGNIKTVEVPVGGKQGGRRWTRMNEEQQKMCTRIAIENPRLTRTQIRQRIQERYPELTTLSDSTVWRFLNSSNLQFLRAKMRDARADGTPAHAAEKESFLTEQKKGEAGELGANDLMFMDESSLYLNETARRAWGTVEHPAEIKHAKGKTVTIGIYAGIGLVSAPRQDWEGVVVPSRRELLPTDPRGNHIIFENDEWVKSEHAPQFALFWWLRPPTRKSTALSKFLNVQDVLDTSFKLKRKSDGTEGDVEEAIIDERGHVNKPLVEYIFNELDGDDIHETLWKCNIEFRQVDDDGALINVKTGKSKRNLYVSNERGKELLNSFKSLVSHALKTIRIEDEDLKGTIEQYSNVPQTNVPRFFHSPHGRQTLGGRIEGERGDQALFIQYLRHQNEYVKEAFGEQVRQNMRVAWDSAPQHGKTDVTKNTKSFIHEWVEKNLNIRGAIFLPVREPDFNPVELLFSFVKGVIRRKFPSYTGEVSVDQMIRMIDEAFSEVTLDMVKGWLRYGCYVIPGDPKDTLVKTERCMYEAFVDIDDMWYELILDWEKKNFALPANLRPRLLAGDDRAMHKFASRFRTVEEACTTTKRRARYVECDGLRRNDDKKIYLVQAVKIVHFDDSVEEYPDNYKSPSHKEIVRLLSARTGDNTGLRVGYARMNMLAQTRGLRDELDTFYRCFDETDGLLWHLNNAVAHANKLVNNLSIQPATTVRNTMTPIQQRDAALEDKINLLLDMQERVFHPKLDVPPYDMVEVTDTLAPDKIVKVKRLKHREHRISPDIISLKYSLGTPENDDKYKIVKIDSKSVEFRTLSNNKSLVVGNTRVCDNDPITDNVADNVAEKVRSILSKTPYLTSVPTKEETTNATYPLAVCVIALKAYHLERTRMEKLASDAMKQVLKYMSDTSDTGGTILQHRLEHVFKESNMKWTRKDPESNTANHLPKLFSINNLRADRRGNVQLRLLARGESDERRWPGYPTSERDKRGDKPIVTVKASSGLEPSKVAKHIRVDFDQKNKVQSIKVTFDDDEEVEFDDDYENDDEYKRHFNKFAEQNQLKLKHAIMRAKEQSHSKESLPQHILQNTIIGTIGDVPVKKHVSSTAHDGPCLLYDSDKNLLYAPDDESVETVEATDDNKRYKIRLFQNRKQLLQLNTKSEVEMKDLRALGVRVHPQSLSTLFPKWRIYTMSQTPDMYRIKIDKKLSSYEQVESIVAFKLPLQVRKVTDEKFVVCMSNENSIIVPKKTIKDKCRNLSKTNICEHNDQLQLVCISRDDVYEYFRD